MEQGVVVEAVLPADPLALLQDLRGMSVFLARMVPRLLKQGDVDHRGGVALGARIPVPVPGPAEVAPLLDDADVADASFHQARGRDQARKTATNEGECDVI